MSKFILPVFLGIVFFGFFYFQEADAVTYTAIKSGNWNDPATWGGIIPGETDDKVIPSGIIVEITLSNINSGTITIGEGGTLEISNSVDWGISNSGVISNSGNVTMLSTGDVGVRNLNDGTITNSGIITVSNSSGTGISNSGTITNSGTIEIFHSGAVLGISNSGTITNSGTISNSGIIRNSNRGTINNLASGTIVVSNSGRITNVSGTIFSPRGTITNSGIIEISNTSGPGISNSGRINNLASGTITVSNSGGPGIPSSGTISNSGTIIVSNPGGTGISTPNHGIINNLASGTIVVSNSGGTGIRSHGTGISNAGIIEISNSADFGIVNSEGTITNSGALAFSGIINNLASGTITVSNSGGTGISNRGTINNLASGTITVSNSGGTGIHNLVSRTSVDSSPGTISNSGTITISNSADTGISNSNIVFNDEVIEKHCGGTYFGNPPIGNPVVDLCIMIPDLPVITSPGDEIEYGPTLDTLVPTFMWTDVEGAEYYALTISEYPYSSENVIYNQPQIFGTSHTVPVDVLEHDTKYRWNMQAGNNAGWSPISNTLYFQTSSEQCMEADRECQLNQLIQQHRIFTDDVIVTVSGNQYVIATLDVKIDPDTLEITSSPTTAYLDVNGNPVSNGDIAQKIGVIERVRAIDQNEISETIDALNDLRSTINTLDRVILGVGILSTLLGEDDLDNLIGVADDLEQSSSDKDLVTALRFTKSGLDIMKANAGNLDDVTQGIFGKLVVEAFKRVFGDPLMEAKADLDSNISKALIQYASVHGTSNSQIVDYADALEFLVNLQTGQRHTSITLYLFNEMYHSYTSIMMNIVDPVNKLFVHEPAFSVVVSVTQHVAEAAASTGWIVNIACEEVIHVHNNNADSFYWVTESGQHTLDLAQAGSEYDALKLQYIEESNMGVQHCLDLSESSIDFMGNLLSGLKNIFMVNLGSPGELRIYDSTGRVTGLVDGEILSDIPLSSYDSNNSLVIVFGADGGYLYEIYGTGTGIYGLDVYSSDDGRISMIGVSNVTITPHAIHHHVSEYDVHSDEHVITTMKDENGDDVFEEITSNKIPKASFNALQPLTTSNIVIFDASQSYDPDGEIILYEWDFGDGNTSTGKVVDHIFDSEGTYSAILTVRDNLNAVAKIHKVIEVISEKDAHPAQQIDDLRAFASSTGVNSNSLNQSVKLLTDNNPNNDVAVCGQINAFINHVDANRKIAAEQQSILTLITNQIKSTLSC